MMEVEATEDLFIQSTQLSWLNKTLEVQADVPLVVTVVTAALLEIQQMLICRLLIRLHQFHPGLIILGASLHQLKATGL